MWEECNNSSHTLVWAYIEAFPAQGRRGQVQAQDLSRKCNHDFVLCPVFQYIILVIIYGTIYYPLLASLTTEHKLVGSVMGFLYCLIRWRMTHLPVYWNECAAVPHLAVVVSHWKIILMDIIIWIKLWSEDVLEVPRIGSCHWFLCYLFKYSTATETFPFYSLNSMMKWVRIEKWHQDGHKSLYWTYCNRYIQ